MYHARTDKNFVSKSQKRERKKNRPCHLDAVMQHLVSKIRTYVIKWTSRDIFVEDDQRNAMQQLKLKMPKYKLNLCVW